MATWNASLYDNKHGFVSQYGEGIVELLNPQAGDRILDLGCGTGHLANTIATQGAQVTGIDGSASMIERARANYPQLSFQVADARNFSFSEPFDAVFSNATLHWVKEAEQVIICIAAALKAGGRFVAEFGGQGNVSMIVSSLQQALRELLNREVASGWYFPSIGEYTPLLEKHGLSVRLAHLFERPTPLQDGEQGLRNWLEMFGGPMFADVPVSIKQQAIIRAEELSRPHLFQNGQWIADYCRLRIVALKI